MERAVSQRKAAIEAAIEALQSGAEALAGAVGALLPLCEAAAPVLRLALDNVQSKEVLYVKEQFVTVRSNMELLCAQLDDVDRELCKSGVDSAYFPVEENLRSQFRKYLDVLEAKPRFRDVKTRLFLEHFSQSGGDKNLWVLYHAAMGASSFGESVLEVVDRYVARSRRLLEDFCVRLKELFCLGLIALLGHAALTAAPAEERHQLEAWSGRMEEAELRMKAAVESCVAAFPEQARLDAQRLLQEEAAADDLQGASRRLLDFLVAKYDWVRWSVRLMALGGSSYRRWRAGDRFHQLTGRNCFEVPQVGGVHLVVSYSGDPRPVPRPQIRELMEGRAGRGDAPAAAEALQGQPELDGFLVHAISRHKEAAAAWSFPDHCHYWGRHGNVTVCVHWQSPPPGAL